MKTVNLVLLTMLIAIFGISLNATTITSTGSGNWNSTTVNAPWPGGIIPGSSDTVTIYNGHTITVTDNHTCGSLIFSTTGTNAVLNINNGISFTVTGSISLGSQSTGSGINTLSVGAGTLNAGSISIIGDNGQRKGLLSISTGTINVTGNLTFTGISTNALLTFTGSGTLNIGGSLSTGGTLTAGTGTINYTGANQTIAPYTYNNLTLSGSGTDNVTSSVIVNGILSMAGSAMVSAAPTYGTSASLQYNGASVQTTGPEFLSTMTIPIVINNSVGVLLSGAKTIQNTLTLDNGWLDNSSPNTLTVGVGGSLVSAGGYLIAPLPVEMTSFTAESKGVSAHIRWATATEEKSYNFEIERRLINTSEYAKIGTVQAAGTSNAPRTYEFTDANLAPGKYAYRLKMNDNDGSFAYFGNAEVSIDAAPNEFSLKGNYPNPFNPSTTIEFTVPQNGHVTLKVYNVIGQQVATLFDGMAQAEQYNKVSFDASKLSSGIYFSTLEFNNQRLVKKMMLTK